MPFSPWRRILDKRRDPTLGCSMTLSKQVRSELRWRIWKGRPLFANPALCSMLGFTEDEIRSKPCVEFSPPEDAEKESALFEQLRAGTIDHYHLDKRFIRRDGSLIWGRLSISLLNPSPSPLVIAMVWESSGNGDSRGTQTQIEAKPAIGAPEV